MTHTPDHIARDIQRWCSAEMFRFGDRRSIQQKADRRKMLAAFDLVCEVAFGQHVPLPQRRDKRGRIPVRELPKAFR